MQLVYNGNMNSSDFECGLCFCSHRPQGSAHVATMSQDVVVTSVKTHSGTLMTTRAVTVSPSIFSMFICLYLERPI